MNLHTEPAVDMFTAMRIPSYPIAKPRLKYDFLFTHKTRWVYVNSSNSIDDLIRIDAPPVEEKREIWRVIEATTGRIVRTNERKEAANG